MSRQKSTDFSPESLRIYDEYVHGQCDRRGFLTRVAKAGFVGASALAMLEALSPQYVLAEQVPEIDERVTTEWLTYPSPEGHGEIRGYAAWPTGDPKKFPAVLVVHENRGLNPYIQDVVRRFALAGFFAFGPDGLTPAGGYPGNDDEGRALQRDLDPKKMEEDFVAAARFLDTHERSTGKVGVVGFCYGGGISNMLATRLPGVIDAAAPFYGRQAAAADVPKIEAPLLIHYAENDERVNAGWPAYEEALKAAGKTYTVHFYPGTNHGFHNDTTPRYDEAAAKLAWERTVEFFRKELASGEATE